MMSINIKLLLTLIVCLILTIIPIKETFHFLRPAFILMLVLYVQCCLPSYFRVMWVFVLGLCLDAFSATVMGEHAFALILTTWIATNVQRSFEHFSMLQQMLIILLFCMVYQFTIYTVDAFFGVTTNLFFVFVSSFVSMLIWPWLRFLLNSNEVFEFNNR
jgi:rod shape-determining protein MreD